jgi:fructose-1,6-bisphosphatase I
MSANENGGAPPVGQEKINTDIVTLTRFLTEEQTKFPEATGDFTYVTASDPL